MDITQPDAEAKVISRSGYRRRRVSAETVDEAVARKRKIATRKRELRAVKKPKQMKNKRRRTSSDYRHLSQTAESSQDAVTRRQREASIQQVHRNLKSPRTLKRRRNANAERTAAARCVETIGETQQRRSQNAEQTAAARARETDDDTTARRSRDRLNRRAAQKKFLECGGVHNKHRSMWIRPHVPNQHRLLCQYRLMPMEICPHCGAFVWREERLSHSSTANKRYKICCKGGEVLIPPLKPPPNELAELFSNTNVNHKTFMKYIRFLNSRLSLSSLTVNQHVLPPDGPPVYKVHGLLKRRMRSLLPEEGDPPKFLSLYFHDERQELKNRMGSYDDIPLRGVMYRLQELIKTVNPLIEALKSVAETLCKAPNGNLRIQLNAEARPTEAHKGSYGVPMSDQVCSLVDMTELKVGERREGCILLHQRGGALQHVPVTHRIFDACGYILLQIHGDEGWTPGIISPSHTCSKKKAKRNQQNDEEKQQSSGSNCKHFVSMQEYASHRFMFRTTENAAESKHGEAMRLMNPPMMLRNISTSSSKPGDSLNNMQLIELQQSSTTDSTGIVKINLKSAI